MEAAESPGRQRILARIRAALRELAPKHAAPAVAGPVFAPIGDPLERFQKECAANNTECLITSDWGASAAAVVEVLGSIPPGEIFVWSCRFSARPAIAAQRLQHPSHRAGKAGRVR